MEADEKRVEAFEVLILSTDDRKLFPNPMPPCSPSSERRRTSKVRTMRPSGRPLGDEKSEQRKRLGTRILRHNTAFSDTRATLAALGKDLRGRSLG